MNSTILKTINRLRYDTSARAIAHSQLVLNKGEPFFVKDYLIGGTAYKILVVGDGERTVDALLTAGEFFLQGTGAGYVLPVANSIRLGGVVVDDSHGLNVGTEGDLWVNVESIAGTNLKYVDTNSGYSGFGKLNVDLSHYKGNVEIEGNLTADRLLYTPTITSNVLKLREPEEGGITPDPLIGSEIAGLEIQHINNSTVYFGIDKDTNLLFKNATNNYHVPLVADSALTGGIALIGLNANGIVTPAQVQKINLQTRKSTTSDWSSQEIDITSKTPQIVQLTIPQKLSDLEDYSDSASGPSYVSGEDRKLWNQTITEVAIDSNTTFPYLMDTYYYEDNGSQRKTKKLFLPQASVIPGAGIQITAGGAVSLAPIEVSRPSSEPLLSPPQITYISNIEVDEYGRVTKIEKITATIA